MKDAIIVRFERFDIKARYTPGTPSPMDWGNKNSHTLTVRNTKTRNRDIFVVWSKSKHAQIQDQKRVLKMFRELLVSGYYGSLPVTKFCEMTGMDPMKKESVRAHVNLRDKADRLAWLLSSSSGIYDPETEDLLPDGTARVKIPYLLEKLKGLGV